MESAAARRPLDIRIDLLAWAGIAIVAALVAAIYYELLFDLASEWWSRPESSYGMLIPPFTLYVVYLRRDAIGLIPKQPDRRGLWLVAAAGLMLLTGRLASEFFLSRVSFVVLLAGLVWTFWGHGRLRATSFQLILLATMVPPPAILYNAAAAPLQLFASKLATDLTQMFGTSVYRDGNVIFLANISLGVAEACSGLQSLSAMGIAALVLGAIGRLTVSGRIVILLFSVPLAIMVNVCRVTGTAILADSSPDLALGYYHAFSGWLVFLVGMVVLWLATRISVRIFGPAS
jgi:exosortase